MRMRTLALSVLLLCAPGLVACGGGDSEPDASSTGTGAFGELVADAERRTESADDASEDSDYSYGSDDTDETGTGDTDTHSGDGDETDDDGGSASRGDANESGASGGDDDPAGSTGPLTTVPVDDDLAAAATANARVLYASALPPGAYADEIEALLSAACPLATEVDRSPDDAARDIVDLMPTDEREPRLLPAMIMIAGRYIVDGGCGDSSHAELVAGELHKELGSAFVE